MHCPYVGVEATQTIFEKQMKTRQSSTRSAAPDMAALDASIKQIRVNARSFYMEAIKQIKDRFTFRDAVYSIVKMVEPSNARALQPNSLAPFFVRFPSLRTSCDPSKADKEWRDHARLKPELFGCENTDQVKALSVEGYWKVVFSCKIADSTNSSPRFPLLTKCISLLFGLATSNAGTERLFSSLKLIKNDQRNRIHDLTVVSLLRIKYWLKNLSATAKDVAIPDGMIDSVMKVKSNATIKDYLGGLYDEEDNSDDDVET